LVQTLTQAQTYGAQSVVVCMQLPVPSQVPSLFVWTLPLQPTLPSHAVPLSGKVQAPVALSQSVAPHGAIVLVHAAVQQWPVPLIPHIPEVQASFSVQAPVAIAVVQVPPLQTNPVAQSALEVQVVLQLLASAHAKWLGQGTPEFALQAPVPLQELVVTVLPLHALVPQEVVFAG
jgi:hypothetical protein